VRRNGKIIAAACYGGLGLVVLGILFQLFPLFLPQSVAGRIAHNSEGMVLALLLAAWIQFARPRLEPLRSNRQWPVTLAVAAACVATAVLLLASDFPSRFRTLNETFLAAAVLIPYVQLRRPLPRWLPAALSLGVLAVMVLGLRTEIVTLGAETLGVLLLAPVGFDLVDRGILDPGARTSTRVRYAWYALLVIAPIAFSALHYGVGFDGVVGEATRYSVRIVEAFLCMLLVELYFAVALGRTGVGARPAGRARQDAGNRR